MSLLQVNAAVVENNTIVQAEVLRTETVGNPVKIKAIQGAKYILAEGENGFAPENITVKRVGKDLHVILEGTEEDQPQLIIEEFFDKPGELVGKAEDGQWHTYIASDGDSDHEAAFLMDGDSSALVLGADVIGSLDGLAVATLAFSPALLALGALAGIAAAIGLANAFDNKKDGGNSDGGDGGDGGGQKPPAPSLGEVIDNKGDLKGPVKNGDIIDDDMPVFTGTGTPGNIVIIRDQGEDIGSTVVGEDGNWTWTPEDPLSEGEHNFELIEKDKEGNESEVAPGIGIIVDITPPAIANIIEVIDDFGPKTGIILSGQPTDDNTPTIKGTAEINSTVEIWLDSELIGSVLSDANGQWSFTPKNGIADGSYQLSLVVVDKAGNRSEATEPFELIIDTRIPGKPGEGDTAGIGTIWDDVGLVVGELKSGDTTDDKKPTLEGSFQIPGSTIVVKQNGTIIGTAIVDENGGWRYETPELTDATYNFSIIIETPTGYTSEESDPWTIIVDTRAPDAPVIDGLTDNAGDVQGEIGAGDITDDATPTLHGTAEQNSTVIIYNHGKEIGRTEADADGNWSWTIEPRLANGPHELSVKAQDKAGNISDESGKLAFEVQAGGVAPTPSIEGAYDDVEAHTGMLGNGAVTNDRQPELRGTAPAGEVVYIRQDGAVVDSVTADADGRWSWTPGTELADGTHRFVAETVDAAGNRQPTGEFALVIDGTAPGAVSDLTLEDNVGPVTGEIKDGDTTDDATPTLRGSGEPGDTIIVKDGADIIGSVKVGADGSWEMTTPPLGDGHHQLEVVVRDAAGNESAGTTVEFDVDTSKVAISIDYAVDNAGSRTGNLADRDVTDDTTPTLHGQAKPNSTVEIFDAAGKSLGSVKANAFGAWSMTLPVQAEGVHRYTAKATDPAGNSATSAAFELEIDTTAPGKPGDGGTGGDGIGGAWDDVGPITGELENGDTTDDNTPKLEGSGLQPGDTVIVKDKDTGEIIGTVIADENGGWQLTPPPLKEGENNLVIVIEDPAGNRSEESDPWTIIVDTRAPDAPVISGAWDNVSGGIENGLVFDRGITNDRTPELRGSAEANTTVRIYDAVTGVLIDTVITNSAGDWNWTPGTELPDGTYRYYVTATDAAGLTSAPSATFTLDVDGTVAKPSISGAWDDVVGGVSDDLILNNGLTNDRTPELRGMAEANSIVGIYNALTGALIQTVTVDGAGNWNWIPDPELADGTYSYYVKATDPAGNVSEASDTFTVEVDGTAPSAPVIEHVIDDSGSTNADIANGGSTYDKTPTFSGSAEPGSTLTLKLGVETYTAEVDENGDWTWTPPTDISIGSYTLTVASTDSAGNVSSSSSWDFTINNRPVKGSEDFNYITGLSDPLFKDLRYKGDATFKSGLNVKTTTLYNTVAGTYVMPDGIQLAASSTVRTPNARFTLPGESTDIQFTWTANVKVTVTVYDPDGNILKTSRIGADIDAVTITTGTFNYEATAGKKVGSIYVVADSSIQLDAFSMDNFSWGNKISTVSSDDFVEDNTVTGLDYLSEDKLETTSERGNDAESTKAEGLSQADIGYHKGVATINYAEQLLDLSSVLQSNQEINVVNMANNENNMLNVTLGDLLTNSEQETVVADGKSTLMIQGDKGDVINLSDLLPDGSDVGDWAKAEGTVTVDGIQYEVYQHSDAESELLVQMGVQTNLDNH